MRANRNISPWLFVGLAFIGLIISYIDRSALSFAITPIENTLGINHAQFGFIASAFSVGYMIMTVGGGFLVDRFHVRKVWSYSALAWSIVCSLLGLATGFWTLFILRGLLGLAEGSSFPALNRLVADWLPPSERAKSLALGIAAVPVSFIIGSPLVSQLIVLTGYKIMFLQLGCLGIIWSIIWYYVYRDPQHIPAVKIAPNPAINSLQPIPKKSSWMVLLSNPALLINNFAYFSFSFLLFFAMSWLPAYLELIYGIHLKQIGWLLTLPWLTALVFLLIASSLSDWLWQKTKNIRIARSYLISACQFLSALSFIPILISPSLTTAIISISLGVGFGMMPNAIFYALNTDLAKDNAGLSAGIMLFFAALGGMLAPALTGILVHITGNFHSVFLFIMILTLSSSLAVVLFQRPKNN